MLRLSVIALAALVALSATPAHADPISAAVAAVVNLFAAATVSSFLARVALSIGLSWLASRLQGKPKFDQSPRAGPVTAPELQAGETIPRSIVFGRTIVAGVQIGPMHTHDLDTDEQQANRRVTEIRALAGHPVDGLEAVVINGERHEIAEMATWDVLLSGGGTTVIKGNVLTMTDTTFTVEDGDFTPDEHAGKTVRLEKQWGYPDPVRVIQTHTADTFTVTEEFPEDWATNQVPDHDRTGVFWPQFNLYDSASAVTRDYGLTPTVGKYAERIGVRFHNGNQTARDDFMHAVYADHPDMPWSDDMIGRGVAYAVINWYVHPSEPDLWASGRPEILFVLRGARMYDPRLDSTVGGDGGMSWTNTGLWQWTDNPAIIRYNLMRGFPIGDPAQGVRYGGGMQMGEAGAYDYPSWFAAANEADELVERDTLLFPRSVIGGEIAIDETPLSVLDDIDANGLLRAGVHGGAAVVTGPTPPAPTLALTDDDVLVDQPRSHSLFTSFASRPTMMVGRFRSADDAYAGRVTGEITKADGEAETRFGRRATRIIDFHWLNDEWRVEDALAFYMQDQDRMRTHELALPFPAGTLTLGDVVSWSSVEHDYDDIDFEVAGITPVPDDGSVRISLREVDPADRNFGQ